ncbi:glycoside hydrolase family 6 protein [Thermomonospora cellulosilytica]|uniref:Glucanase n=1 Tax=Thermomonospora cellulosilytica TaxID=1411118 RepID=A0A7W3MTH0_9ACTN|nr:glycoside hydrolase family 6 protein [Thermomonospora cellulosilytica]MBA9001610.1 cellulose 1,4-beta-cellobiosidase [Thermomonospora cellulosilytica]
MRSQGSPAPAGPPTRSARARRGLAAGTAALMLAGGVVAAAQQASAAASCKVAYTKNDWGSGFTASITITNTGDALSSWTLRYSYSGNQRLASGWNGRWSQSGQQITVQNEAWNGSLATGATINVGAQFSYSGTNADPTSFTLNGTPCNGDGGGPTPTPTTPTPDPTSPGNRLDNPYVGAKPYVNPEWSAKAAAEPGGSRIANQPTGVWLDRIAAIEGVNGGMGLRDHLDEALEQGANLIQIVIYNLPGRDCSALASNGELGPDDLPRYKAEYIDPIAAIMDDAKYANLRIVTVIEIDSLPNLVTNVSGRPTATEMCDRMKANGGYVNGVGYALNKLGAIPNVYNYIDAGHHGWLGWDDNFGPSVDLIYQAANASGSTPAKVHGFITNTANYSALKEPYFTINDTVNGTSVRQSKWVDWNRFVDELSYAQAFRERAVQAGFDRNVGMLIDTSRNGWGGPNRPTGPGPMTDVNAYVNGGRIDRRIHLGNWCNQAGAGLGERPKAAPEPGIDAYVWIKPPGESDGASKEIQNDEGKGFDRMCDPTYTGNARNGNNMSGALPDAPLSGHWFSAQFQELMRNAYPPLN